MNALSRLALAHGIGLHYHDIWGTLHNVPDETLRALLGTMGVPASTEEDVETALAAHARAIWVARIDAMVVVREDVSPARIRLHLPFVVDIDSMHVQVATETGHDHRRPVLSTIPVAESDVDGERWRALDVQVALALPVGYHRLDFVVGNESVAQTQCAVSPRACYRPSALRGGARSWGVAVQLYGVRSRRNWGIGDFTDLGAIVTRAGEQGADIVGVNPLHALFPHNPLHISPYSPSSRLFANPLYLDVEAIADLTECEPARALLQEPAFARRLATLRDAPLVDYPGVAAAKHEVLEHLYASFRDRHLKRRSRRARRFGAFKRAGGEALRRHALFEALQEHCFAQDACAWGWPAWPARFHDPRSADVARFAKEHAARVDYYAYLQWQVELQRATLAKRASEAGLAVGLYTDLAVSTDRGGAESWAYRWAYAPAASVGAPPDAFNRDGQDWGLPPLVPSRLRASGYAPFIATLRANMRNAGALRIDHVMVLMRLFWIPQGGTPAQGAYVHYPFEELVGLVALESQRHRCMVIGEDLGTVPDEVRRTLSERDVLSYRVLLFERDGAGEFKSPEAYPEAAVATASTHDLPTMAGWWEGHEIEVRASLGMIGPEATRLHDERTEDRGRLLRALARVAVLPQGASSDPQRWPTMSATLAESIAAFLAGTPSVVLVLQLEDLLREREQANLPGTTDAHPNWRRKLSLAIDEAFAGDAFRSLAARLSKIRPRRAS